MSLDHVRRTYEEWGREDPLYAVLTHEERRGGRWDPDAFFRTGEDEIAEVLAWVDGLDVEVRRGRALDFGCGVGRLTQALGEHFEQVAGVDISSSMIERAEAFNRHGRRVRYLVNTREDLSIFQDDVFDFVYSSITLQHIPPRIGRHYIGDFFRVLKPGGVAVFQMRSGPRVEFGSFRAWLYTLNREHIRHVLQRLKGKPPYEIHFLARSQVEEIIEGAGAELVEALDVGGPGREGRSYRYCARVPRETP